VTAEDREHAPTRDAENPPSPPTDPPRKPRRRRRWLLRTVLLVLVLVALLAATVQVILRTDLPRQWVLAAVQQKLQLRLGAREFTTGWRGYTSLGDVTLSLPLAEESFLRTSRLSIKHTGILGLLIQRSITVESIEIDRPEVHVRQMADGRWNVQEVVELIRRATGGKTADPATQQPRELPQLPRVTIRDATVHLVDLRNRQADLGPLTIRGAPDGPLVWNYDASTPDRLHVTGQLAPGGDWSHEAEVSLRNLGPLLRPFLTDPSSAVVTALERFKLSGRWTGRVAGNLRGRLDLTELSLAGYTVTGPLGVSFAEGVTTVTPTGAVVTPPNKEQVPPARAAGGMILVEGKSATVRDLALAFAGGEVRIGGSYAWDRGVGKLEAWWNKLVLPADTTHSGSLTASLRQPWPNQPVIDAELTTSGQRGVAHEWSARLELRGSGTGWDQIAWRLTAPNLVYRRGKQTYNLDGLEARLATRGDVLTLDGLDVPPGNLYGRWKRGTLAASGAYHRSSGAWNAYLTGDGWPIDPNAKAPANFLLDAYGDRTWAELGELFVEGAGVQLWARGRIAYRAPGAPAELHVHGWYPPIDYTWHERDADPREDVRLSGRLESELHVTGGAASPIRLDVNGRLLARDFRVRNHPVGDVTLAVSGRADDEGVNVRTRRLDLFSGQWELTGRYTWKDRLSRVSVDLYDLSLAQLDNFASAPPNLRGTLGGHWNIDLPDFDPRRMTAEGRYQVQNLARLTPPPPTTSPAVASAIDRATTTNPVVHAAGARPAAHVERVSPTTMVVSVAPATRAAGPGSPASAPTTQVTLVPIADGIEGVMTAADGVVRLDPILLRRRGGRAEARARFPITAPRQVHVEASAAAWPVEPWGPSPRGTPRALVWLQAKLDADLKRLTADGQFSLRADVPVKEQSVVVNVDALVRGRTLDVRTLRGQGIGGEITGDGYVYLDSPLQSTGRVDWRDLDATSVVALVPELSGLAGKFSGTVRFSPTSRELNPDATGPFAVQGTLKSEGGRFDGMTVGDADFLLYSDYRRAVLEHLRWNLADGQVNAWARFTQRGGDGRFVHLNVDFDRLNLDQIVRAARPAGQQHKEMPGLLAGRVIAAGNPFTPEGRKTSSGEARLRVTESDLANVKIIDALYALLSVKFGQRQPTGHGFAQARLEGERLEIPVVRYVNRGVDVWASATVADVFQGTRSPIVGTAAGSARPLKDLKLPFMADVDKVLAAFVGGLATVEIRGTVREPDPKVIPFAQSGDSFRRFLIGDVKNEVRGTAGR
jgi:hypothetical protein